MEIGTNSSLLSSQGATAKAASSEDFAPLSFRKVAVSNNAAQNSGSSSNSSVGIDREQALSELAAVRPGTLLNIVI